MIKIIINVDNSLAFCKAFLCPHGGALNRYLALDAWACLRFGTATAQSNAVTGTGRSLRASWARPATALGGAGTINADRALNVQMAPINFFWSTGWSLGSGGQNDWRLEGAPSGVHLITRWSIGTYIELRAGNNNDLACHPAGSGTWSSNVHTGVPITFVHIPSGSRFPFWADCGLDSNRNPGH